MEQGRQGCCWALHSAGCCGVWNENALVSSLVFSTLKSGRFFPAPRFFWFFFLVLVLWLQTNICEADRTAWVLCHRHLLKGYIRGRKSGHSPQGTAGIYLISASANGKTGKGWAAQHWGSRACWQGPHASGSFVRPTVERAKPSTYPLLKDSICRRGTQMWVHISTDVGTHLHRKRILPSTSIKGNVSQSASLGIVKERA